MAILYGQKRVKITLSRHSYESYIKFDLLPNCSTGLKLAELLSASLSGERKSFQWEEWEGCVVRL